MGLFKKKKDERISAQVSIYYKTGFWIMGIGILIDLYVKLGAQQFTDTAVGSAIENVAVLAGFLYYVAIQMVQHGIFDDDMRYAETERLLWRRCLRLGAAGSVIASIVLVGGHVYNEAVYEGFGQADWAGDAAIFAVILFVEMVAWSMSKRRRDRSGE